MSDITEDQVRQKLGIDSWRNLSKESVMQLVEMMPAISKETALTIAENFPDFKLLATETLDSISKQLKPVLKSNDKSQKRAQQAYALAQEAFVRELDKDLSAEERREVYGLILDAADKISAKDAQNKQFVLQALSMVGLAAVGVLVVAVKVAEAISTDSKKA